MRAIIALVAVLASSGVHAEEESETRARAHYEIGLGLYRLGDYRGAIKEFAAGYELARRPGFLLNLAHSHRKLGELARARELYLQFQETLPPNDPQRPKIQAIVDEIAVELKTHPPATETVATKPATETVATKPATETVATKPATETVPPAAATLSVAPPRRGRPALRIAGLVIGPIGIGFLGAGLACGLVADSAANDLTATTRMGGVYDPSRDSSYRTDRALEYSFFAVGSAAVVTGVVLYVVGRR